jgi:predicted AlkP superfamily phosphohydrolase/phosphomutase
MTDTPRLLIAGLDGATWNVLEPLLRAGKLPNLAALRERGSYGPLTSVWPPISAAAWASMLTGCNPGLHGVFDFRNLDLSRYGGHRETLSSASDIAVPTLFDHVGRAGSIAYQIPLTYPPHPIHGVMVAGYPTPDRRIAYTWPKAWGARLSPLETHASDQIGRLRPDEQLEAYRRGLDRLTENVIRLSRETSWRLLMYVTGAPDGAHHRFFKYVTPGFPGVTTADQTRYGQLMDDVMRAVDDSLGRILAALSSETNVLVISDHGGTARPRRAFNGNAWLREEGWLALHAGRRAGAGARAQRLVEWAKQTLPVSDWVKQHLPATTKQRLTALRGGLGQIDWSRTQAYRVKLSFPIEGIHLNIAGRQPQGVVPLDQYGPLREAIMESLGKRAEVISVQPREAVFHGPFLNEAPDILYQLRPDLDGGADLEHVQTDLPASWLQAISGYHDMDGIVVAAGPSFGQGKLLGARLVDVMPTALHALALPVPAGIDGRVLEAAFATPGPVRYSSETPESPAEIAGDINSKDAERMLAALRDLGYVD